MKKFMILLGVLLLYSSTLASQINWNFSAGTASPSATAANITASDLSQGNNVGTTTLITSTNPSFNYPNASGTYNAAATVQTGYNFENNTYFEFTLTPDDGYTVTVTGMSFGTRSTSTGPQTGNLKCSLDNYAGYYWGFDITNNSVWQWESAGFPPISSSGSNPITFRIYVYNGVGTATPGVANWRIDDLSVTVSAALPIQLSSFTGNYTSTSNSIRLNWSTISETNNYGFNVYRKISTQSDFTELPNSFVAGHGTTVDPQHYAYIDNTVIAGITYQYELKQTDLNGDMHFTDAIAIATSALSVNSNIPAQYGLKQNYPNPFNPSTTIEFTAKTTEDISLNIYNSLGQLVSTINTGQVVANAQYKLQFNGSNLSSGVYFYRLQSNSMNETKVMLLSK